MLRVLGIDLAGSPKRPTGWLYLGGDRVEWGTVYLDEEIISLVEGFSPMVAAIDSPLTLPRHGYDRVVDKLMRKRGLRVLPPLFGGMAMLTRRGVRLAKTIRGIGVKVIEVHPSSTAKRLGVERSLEGLLTVLGRLGYRADLKGASIHEIDAGFAAVTGLLFLRGDYEAVKAVDGCIIIPRQRL